MQVLLDDAQIMWQVLQVLGGHAALGQVDVDRVAVLVLGHEPWNRLLKLDTKAASKRQQRNNEPREHGRESFVFLHFELDDAESVGQVGLDDAVAKRGHQLEIFSSLEMIIKLSSELSTISSSDHKRKRADSYKEEDGRLAIKKRAGQVYHALAARTSKGCPDS